MGAWFCDTVRGLRREGCASMNDNLPDARRDDFLKRAAEADGRAGAAVDIQIRLAWVNVAASWRQMAEQAERMRR